MLESNSRGARRRLEEGCHRHGTKHAGSSDLLLSVSINGKV